MAIELDAAAGFKILADASRLRLLAILLFGGERSVEELAEMLRLRPATVSHHLSRLAALGLVQARAQATRRFYHLDRPALAALSRDLLSTDRLAALVNGIDADAWRRAVLRDFTEAEQLRELPRSRVKRTVVLRWLAGKLAPGTDYTDTEVDRLLARHHPDAVSLRHELIGQGLLQERAGSYRLT